MTVADIAPIVSTIASGQTVFPFDFRADEITWVLSSVDDVDIGGYTITINADQENDPGGEATYGVAPTNGTTVAVFRATEQTQDRNYPIRGAFPSQSHEGALDKLTMQVQELQVNKLEIPVPVRFQDGGTTGTSRQEGIDLLSDVDSAAENQVLTRSGGNAVWENSAGQDLDEHEANVSNPHIVTKAQVGLGNVDNTSDLDKPVSTAVQGELDNKEPQNANIQAHIADTNNPHGVDAGDLGLGNVDNTSDVDKPISTATQTALDGKVDDSDVIDIPQGGTGEATAQAGINALSQSAGAEDNEVLTKDSGGDAVWAPAPGQGGGEINDAINVGGGAGIFNGDKTGTQIELRSIIGAGGAIDVVENADDITLTVNPDDDKVEDGVSLGVGNAVFVQKTGVNLEFRSLNGEDVLLPSIRVRSDGDRLRIDNKNRAIRPIEQVIPQVPAGVVWTPDNVHGVLPLEAGKSYWYEGHIFAHMDDGADFNPKIGFVFTGNMLPVSGVGNTRFTTVDYWANLTATKTYGGNLRFKVDDTGTTASFDLFDSTNTQYAQNPNGFSWSGVITVAAGGAGSLSLQYYPFGSSGADLVIHTGSWFNLYQTSLVA